MNRNISALVWVASACVMGISEVLLWNYPVKEMMAFSGFASALFMLVSAGQIICLVTLPRRQRNVR